MALSGSGQISLNDVNVELGNSGTAQISMGSSAVRGLFGIASGAISMSDGYGKANETTLTSAGNVNGQAQQKEITVSNIISSGGTLIIPSNIWVWSDDTGNPAILVDVPCTIKNSGKIIGKGGAGGDGNNASVAGRDGGDAIKINSGVSGVTIQNLSGGYIAGGGGGGSGGVGRASVGAGGGGGAGGGNGGQAEYKTLAVGQGGALNASGTRSSDNAISSSFNGNGGGAGGGGGSTNNGYVSYNHVGVGGGGGRILPGTGGLGATAGSFSHNVGGNGGSGGNAGGIVSQAAAGGAGGGGWGASGGTHGDPGEEGGDGGKAVNDSGVSYTLSNSGTIYGGT